MKDRGLMDYILLTKRMLRRLLDVNVCGVKYGEMSDQFLLDARLKVLRGWRSSRRV